MRRARWLIVIAVAGAAFFALSFVNAWIVHDRELRGEGYRFVQYFLSAWRGVGMPVLTIAALAALGAGAWALLLALASRRSLPAWPLVAGSVLALGLVVASAWPVSQDGHASSVDLSAGLLLPIGVILAMVMLAGAVAVVRPGRAALMVVGVAVLVVIGVGAGGRWVGLQQAEGTGRHWSEGSYRRPATDGRPAATLTIDDGSFGVDERWGGTWEGSGWTVVIDNDPACPGSRGTYHAHGEDEEALRFVKVVDTCLDGERAADLETGVWERLP